MSDLINRMDAIEKLEYFCMVKALEDQNHPSAEARTQMSSADLISRQDAINAIEDLPNCHNGYSDTYDKACIIGTLEDLPSAEPEIICCKDCKYREELFCYGRGYPIQLVPDNGFCDKGEMK